MNRVNVGVIGCGVISGIYLKNLKEKFRIANVIAVCDINLEQAEKTARLFDVPYVYNDPKDLVSNSEVEVVLVLTTPQSHAPLCKMALEAGKHVFCEKPLATELRDGIEVVRLAEEKGLRLGCAPETFLGAGIQTSKKLLEDGWIGRLIGARCNVIMFGPETWHPNPAFFYKKGAGPMLDWGPYYISALAYLLGPIKRVVSYSKVTYPQRKAFCKERYGEIFDVEVPTFISGILEHENGAITSLTITFDACSNSSLDIEIMGTEGSLIVPNPDTFGNGSEIRYKKLQKIKRDNDQVAWSSIPFLIGSGENNRGIGFADMLEAIRADRPHRVNGNFALHVLEVMLALERGMGDSVCIEHSFLSPSELSI